MGINAVEAKQWLDTSYGDSAVRKTTMADWCVGFNRGRTSTHIGGRCGRSKATILFFSFHFHLFSHDTLIRDRIEKHFFTCKDNVIFSVIFYE